MLSLFECGGVGSIPEPHFVPALMPVQATPRAHGMTSAAVHASAVARTRGAAVSARQCMTPRQAAISAINVGEFRDDYGSPYHPSPAEIEALKEVLAELKRGEDVPGLM